MNFLKRFLPRLLQFFVYLCCAYWVLGEPPGWGPYGLEGSEFSGGSVTGPLLNLRFAGVFVFAGSALLALVFPRISALAAIVASLLCLPLYLYFVTPRVYYLIWWREWSEGLTHLPPYLVADKWAIENILALLLAASLSIYILRSVKNKNLPKPSASGDGTNTPHASVM